jgi:hypothetical protein
VTLEQAALFPGAGGQSGVIHHLACRSPGDSPSGRGRGIAADQFVCYGGRLSVRSAVLKVTLASGGQTCIIPALSRKP